MFTQLSDLAAQQFEFTADRLRGGADLIPDNFTDAVAPHHKLRENKIVHPCLPRLLGGRVLGCALGYECIIIRLVDKVGITIARWHRPCSLKCLDLNNVNHTASAVRKRQNFSKNLNGLRGGVLDHLKSAARGAFV